MLAVVKLTKEDINEIVAIGRRIGPNYANAYPDLVMALTGVGFTVQEYAHDAPIPSGSNVVVPGRTILFRSVARSRGTAHEALDAPTQEPRTPVVYIGLKDPYDANYLSVIGLNIWQGDGGKDQTG